MENKKSSTRKTEALKIQQRDIDIFKFLDRVGYANLDHVTTAIYGLNTDKEQSSIKRRLPLLRRFGYIKVFQTHLGNYYSLDKKGKVNNPLITSIKLDQLEHHNFLNDLFLHVQSEQVVSEREVIFRYKVVGKKGRIPDMIINEWIIEFERSSKNNVDTQEMIFHWTVEQGKNLCVIYQNEEIKNRYSKLLNPRVKLLAKAKYQEILNIINGDKINNNLEHANFDDVSSNKSVMPKVFPENIRRILDKYK